MDQPTQQYYRHGNALALFKRIGDHKDFWEDRWKSVQLRARLEKAKSGDLNEFEYGFMKYLPRDAPVLEAGCGTSTYVCALQARGLQVEGVDYADETIGLVREIDPTLNVRVGDVYNIDRPDEHYGGYISIGVFEHRWDGPQPGLEEAFRVLRPDGVAIINVPYMNYQRRRMWRKLPEATSTELEGGLRFYQDHYDVRLFSQEIENAGFEIVELYPYSLLGALSRDWSFGRWLQKHGYFHWRLARLAKRICWLAPRWLRFDHCHMMMFICRKPATRKQEPEAENLARVAN